MIFYFDGGCKPNPGIMEICVLSEDKTVCLFEKLDYGTNNKAEWTAVILALETALTVDGNHELRGDSTLVVKQASGEWKINDADLRLFKAEYDRVIKGQEARIKLTYVPRAKNLAGVYLENRLKK